MEREITQEDQIIPPSRWHLYGGKLAAIWTVLILASLFWSLSAARKQTLDAARLQARALFAKDLVYRQWSALRGGAYVPSDEQTPPNPYLTTPERDLVTPAGKPLTLVNPAYMTRQVHELEQLAGGIRSHITSLKPLRPENGADPWETQALREVEKGVPEVASEETVGDQEVLRFMGPLVTHKPCLKCHGVQGYKEGDIRGGISITIPLGPMFEANDARQRGVVLGHGILAALGFLGIFLITRRLARQSSQRQRAAAKAAQSERQYRSLFDASADAGFLIEGGGFLDCNRAAMEFFGWSREELLRLGFVDLLADLQPNNLSAEELAVEVFARAFTEGRALFECNCCVKDGAIWPVEVLLTPLPTDERQLVQAKIRDISVRKKLEAKLARLATIDDLTGICNRRRFNEKTRMELARCRRYATPLTLAMLDVDHFKRVNDSHGHAVGDEVLQALVGEVQSVIRDTDVFGRVGGEEFAILFTDTPLNVAQRVCQRIRLGIAAMTVATAAGPLTLTVTIGLSEATGNDTPDSLFERADKALYLGKAGGRNQVVVQQES